jgi:mono/diheme cytochrome c family protein
MRFMAIALVLCAGVASAQVAAKVAPAKSPAANDAQIARGKYIVEGVARCTQCHTPVNSRGDQENDQHLMGGPVQLQATYPAANWAIRVPRIAGGPPGTDDEVIRELMTGISRFGTPLNPPMPQFRMTREDAQAVLAYLKSLPK